MVGVEKDIGVRSIEAAFCSKGTHLISRRTIENTSIS